MPKRRKGPIVQSNDNFANFLSIAWGFLSLKEKYLVTTTAKDLVDDRVWQKMGQHVGFGFKRVSKTIRDQDGRIRRRGRDTWRGAFTKVVLPVLCRTCERRIFNGGRREKLHDCSSCRMKAGLLRGRRRKEVNRLLFENDAATYDERAGSTYYPPSSNFYRFVERGVVRDWDLHKVVREEIAYQRRYKDLRQEIKKYYPFGVSYKFRHTKAFMRYLYTGEGVKKEIALRFAKKKMLERCPKYRRRKSRRVDDLKCRVGDYNTICSDVEEMMLREFRDPETPPWKTEMYKLDKIEAWNRYTCVCEACVSPKYYR